MPSYHFDVYGQYESNWCHELSIRGIKMADIALLFILSGVLGYIVAVGLSNFFVYKEENYSNTKTGMGKLIMEILLEFALIGILIYASRQLIQAIPSPFDGMKGLCVPKGFNGFIHKKLREWENPYPIAFFIILFQDSLRNKIKLLTKYLGLDHK